jgi:hypothetical protein
MLRGEDSVGTASPNDEPLCHESILPEVVLANCSDVVKQCGFHVLVSYQDN